MVQSQVTQCKLTHIMIIAPGPAHCVMWASFHRVSRWNCLKITFCTINSHFTGICVLLKIAPNHRTCRILHTCTTLIECKLCVLKTSHQTNKQLPSLDFHADRTHFVQVCRLSLNVYNNTLRKFYKFSDSRQSWTSPTLQSADWPISRQYHRPQMR